MDLSAAVPQVMAAGLGSAGVRGAISLFISCAFNLAYFASMLVYVGMIARLPMVAGWDGLLPGWWSELHVKFRTPWKAIAAVTAAMMALGALSLWGAGNQEAVQVARGRRVRVSFCIMYMLLFGVILLDFRTRAIGAGIGLRLAALAAFLVSFCALIFEVVPLGEVTNRRCSL